METSISEANQAVLQAQNDRWGLRLIETINSIYNVPDVNVQNHWWGLGPIETSNSDANHVVLHAQHDRWGLGPIETIKSGHNVAVVNAQNHNEGCDP